ncbi:DNA topoisomerase-1 [Alkalispirochaeta americana]|uniref:DNA topoisomerase 1 n=1 Tax=Alkalispirochaeta americana TaxID=159291 RepID=A0A1N6VNM3_9SPIO|nr:type I DNA topoisomerase [Alkalispirochaeta americana]SIQ79451.1 DNA topoisomerase-1 [Alkalispirochaeta americana]
MSESALVIVESPTKARTIKRFLPPEYVVEASIGHVRDLPQSAAEIPARVKKEPWARVGINVEDNFAPLYVTPKGKAKIIKHLKEQLKQASVLYLATDEDREGESISWHLLEVLKPKIPVRRMVFHEITRSAISHALKNYRSLDLALVRAQETRRILDRLYGYTLSPLIWKKIAYGLSAGRVQSPGLRMIVERERERIRFVSSEYWDLAAILSKPGHQPPFEARLTEFQGKRVASGKDFDPATGTLKSDALLQLDRTRVEELQETLQELSWAVKDVKSREVTSRPAPPFITSTLQQEGNRKLGLSARETMRTAQRLYEEGYITYMRTDSPSLSSEAVEATRKQIRELYGADYLAREDRQHNASQGAQEAHEAIRPAGDTFRHPDETSLTGRERSLYELIWKRTLASQMANARKRSQTVLISVGEATFSATGNAIEFPGFLRVYVEGADNPEAALENKEVLLPPLAEGDPLAPEAVKPDQHRTKPPARYTEASLVQQLEKRGIGRPSTYAAIIATLYERSYIRRQEKALAPTFTGMAVIQLLENHFEGLITYSFTRDMENALDEIALGERESQAYLKEFYLSEEGLQKAVERRESEIQPDASRSIALPQLREHQTVKVGRYGPYIIHYEGDQEVHASIPEEYAPADLTEEDITELIEVQKKGPAPIGTDPESGKNVFCLTGRYGPYVQLGETDPESSEKPKRASLPKGVRPSEITLELALKLLSLPRTLGIHPESAQEVVANIGRFGPFVVCNGEFRSLKKEDDVYTITLERSLELLAEEKKGRRGGPKVLRDFGKDPGKNRKVAIYDGRYGPYIKAGTKNFSLPEELQKPEEIEKITLEQVLEIIKQA